MTVDQTLSLQAHAYDVDTGTMDDSQLEWISDRDGSLGNGDQLAVVGLSDLVSVSLEPAAHHLRAVRLVIGQ